MAPLSVTVTGSSTITREAERGILRVSAKAEGPEKEPVSQAVTSASSELHRMFTELSPKTEVGAATADAPITVFSSTMLRTWHFDLKESKSEKKTRVHNASSSYSVTFRNFAKLGEVIGQLMMHPHVSIDKVEWKLTDITIKSLHSESRKLAMQNAIEKANDYAGVVKQNVFAREINDSGYFSGAMAQQQQQQQQQVPRGHVTVKFESEPEM
ncbi:unnamed protein product [Penicillium pancosmium]